MPHLLSPQHEAAVFWRLRGHLLANRCRQALRHARLRVSLVLVLSLVFWVGLYVLCFEAFDFLKTSIRHDETLEQVVSRIFGVFFASLLAMLVFSTGIILYGSLFRSRETAYLLTLPVRPQRICTFKFQEALVFSSWGFMLMGSPMLVAYGQVAVAPWYYYALLLPFMVAFACIPGAAGALSCLAIVRWLPKTRLRLLLAAGGLALAGVAWLGWTMFRGPHSEPLTPAWFQEVMGRLQFSQHQLLPSWWLSAGVLETSRGEWSEGVMFLSLTMSNALMGHLLAGWAASRMYRRAYHELHAERVRRKPLKAAWIDRAVHRSSFFLGREMRLLIVKDLRLFRRDPVQWSQFLIFFGLLALYFLNVRRLTYDVN